MPPALVPDALRDHPFATATAAVHGVTGSALRGPQWVNLFRNVWVHVDVELTFEMRLAAVRLVLPPGAFICGLTAAWVYGIDVQDRRGLLVWYGVPTGRSLRARPGTAFRELTVTPADLTEANGSAITTPVRTAFDCGRWLSFVEAVVVADALAHAGLISAAGLAEYYRTHRGLRGVRTVAQVIEHLEPLAESPMESRVRMRIELSGLPRPQCQICFVDHNGIEWARGDMGYPEVKLLIEYDGEQHFAQVAADERRRARIRAEGWEVIVFTKGDYYGNESYIPGVVRAALARRGWQF